ncbi:integration host factor subunit alpha [Methylocystis sp. ATCC 49242]|uniref:integration host factor subunit alpha n=1 Tax=Methylocystis sp. ATCC 49242 TaxID=622637 RepID=UPI0001F88628|nr:integration host factor subunit alpha [Methylocystis sp. ATCC 49242]
MTTADKLNGMQSDFPEDDDRETSRGALTRQDIALAIHRRIEGVSRREAKRIVDCVIDEMVSTLVSGESLKLHDFGSFLVREKEERSGRNPRTGAPVPIEARRVVVFKASPNMKATVNGEPPAPRDKTPEKRRPSRKNETITARQKSDAIALGDTLAE